MSALLTITYPDQAAARAVLAELDDLQVHHDALVVHDAVIMHRRQDGQLDTQPWIRQAVLETGASALIGGVIGSLLFAPLLGAALGAAAGATRAALTDLGIQDDYLQQLGQALAPGGTAVIVLADVSNPGPVQEALARRPGQVVQTNLSAQAEQRLRAALDNRAAGTQR